MKKNLTPIQKINKLKAEIKKLNSLLKKQKPTNSDDLAIEIELLKMNLNIEMENHYWENYLSI